MQRLPKIILFNDTIYPDDVLMPLLKKAMHRTECAPTVVVVIKHIRTYTDGSAQPAKQYVKEHKGNTPNEIFPTNGAYITIRIPRPCYLRNCKTYIKNFNEKKDYNVTLGLILAELFYAYAVHEFKHVADFQMKRYFDSEKVRYAKREQEWRANVTEKMAVNDVRLGFDDEARLAIMVFAAIISKELKKNR